MREIVTIQVGNYSNYIGQHFWNIENHAASLPQKLQDLDKNCFMVERTAPLTGRTASTPRTLVVDLQDSLGSMMATGNLYAKPTIIDKAKPPPIFTWDGAIKLCQQERVDRSTFQQQLDASSMGQDDEKAPSDIPVVRAGTLSAPKVQSAGKDAVGIPVFDDVKSWTDYAEVHYHPKSIFTVPGLSEEGSFDLFMHGQNVVSNIELADDLLNRIRFFSEECDCMQGFHFIADVQDAFGGIACEIQTIIRDEYSNKARFVFPVTPHLSFHREFKYMAQRAQMNSALCLRYMMETASLVAPIFVDSWGTDVTPLPLDVCKMYESAAVAAAALHTTSLPYRLAAPQTHMKPFAASMALQTSLRLCSLATASPPFNFSRKPMEELFPIPKKLKRHKDPLECRDFMHYLSYRPRKDVESWTRSLYAESAVFRGGGAFEPPQQEMRRKPQPHKERFDQYMQLGPECDRRCSFYLEPPLAIPITYPKRNTLASDKTGMLTSLTSSAQLAPVFTESAETIRQLSHKLVHYAENMGKDELLECADYLLAMSDSYAPMM